MQKWHSTNPHHRNRIAQEDYAAFLELVNLFFGDIDADDSRLKELG